MPNLPPRRAVRVNRLGVAIFALAALLLIADLVVSTYARAHGPWMTVRATSYASFERLAGHGWVACPGYGRLDDRAYTVAYNALPCGTRIIVCGRRCHAAVVTDRTGFRGLEMSLALALATGRTRAGWDAPGWVRVRADG